MPRTGTAEAAPSGLRPETETQPDRRPEPCGQGHQPGRPGGRGHSLPRACSLGTTRARRHLGPRTPREQDGHGVRLGGSWAGGRKTINEGANAHSRPVLRVSRAAGHGAEWLWGDTAAGERLGEALQQVARSVDTCAKSRSWLCPQSGRGHPGAGAGAGAAGQSSSGLGLSSGWGGPGRPGDRRPREAEACGLWQAGVVEGEGRGRRGWRGAPGRGSCLAYR